jgi:hypothetical protein
MVATNLAYVNHLPLPEAALAYAQWGFRVFPLAPGGKQPLVKWSTEATTDEETIKRWWETYPSANIGICMGNGWAALDLDNKEGRDGWQSYLSLDGLSPAPWPMQRTPSGGHHLLWAARGETLANFTRRGPHGGLDMRTDGGYIAVSPSKVGGESYQWVDGDPSAPIPERLWKACEEWSKGARERSIEAFPIPEPSDLGAADVKARIGALGADHARFLTRGEGATGDASRDAYNAVLRAFSMGWTLADMAAIGPETHLAVFGKEPPHHASDPWAWVWKYTVQAAWRDWKKKASEPQADPEALSTYDLLLLRAQGLAVEDSRQARELVIQIACSGLGEDEVLMLLHEAKKATGISLDLLRTMLRVAREKREKRPVEPANEVYIADQAKVIDRRSGVLISREAFLVEKAREFDGDKARAEQAWLTGKDARCEQAQSLVYHPGLPRGVITRGAGVRVYNSYCPSRLQPVPGDVEPWLSLLRALDLEEGERGAEWLLDRLAWYVQRPGFKVNHGILLGGDKGIGKDSFLSPVLDAVGRHNVTVAEGSELASEFNSFLARTKVLIVNEIDYGNHRDREIVGEKLKRVLAAPPLTLRVNEKNLRPYEIPNLVQVVMLTNHRLCLHIDPGERRYLPLWCRLSIPDTGEAKRAWDQWFIGYWKWLEQGGVARVAHWLQSRDISHLSPGERPPITKWTEDLMRQSRDGLEVWLLEQISQGTGLFAHGAIATEDILALIETGKGRHWISGRVTPQRLARAMTRIGAESIHGRRRGWIVRKVQGARADMVAAEKTARVLQIDAIARKKALRPRAWMK